MLEAAAGAVAPLVITVLVTLLPPSAARAEDPDEGYAREVTQWAFQVLRAATTPDTEIPPVPLDPERDRTLWDGDVSEVDEDEPMTGSGETEYLDEPWPYSSLQSDGNSEDRSAELALDPDVTRNDRSEKSVRITMQPGAQRLQLAARGPGGRWQPDDEGSVDLWYGLSIRYGSDWGDQETIERECTAEYWHTPLGFRSEGPNGSLNVSGDDDDSNGEDAEQSSVQSTPATFYLRRNSIRSADGFYDDGLGTDKLPLGPIVTDEWMDMVFHVRWDTTSGNAVREAWRDGEYMGERTSLNAVDTEEHSFRIGLYQTTEIDHERTAWYDNVRIGTSYAAVDPNR